MLQRIYSLFLISLALLFQESCKNRESTTEEAASIVTPVTVTPVFFKTMKSVSDLPAISSFLRKSTVRATAAGYLQKAEVLQGDLISSNQLLFTIRTRESIALENLNNNDTTLNLRGLINIKSPAQGIITSVKYQAGDYVQEGDELATIADQNSLVFILEVPVEMDKYVSSNRNCTVQLPDSTAITGVISGKLPEMNLETQTLRYMVRISSNTSIPENLIAKVPVVKSTHKDTMVLPRKAVLSNETQTEFWVMKLISDSVAVKTIVKTGLENKDEIEITDPVFTGSDRIIMTGNYGLADTADVSVSGE